MPSTEQSATSTFVSMGSTDPSRLESVTDATTMQNPQETDKANLKMDAKDKKEAAASHKKLIFSISAVCILAFGFTVGAMTIFHTWFTMAVIASLITVSVYLVVDSAVKFSQNSKKLGEELGSYLHKWKEEEINPLIKSSKEMTDGIAEATSRLTDALVKFNTIATGPAEGMDTGTRFVKHNAKALGLTGVAAAGAGVLLGAPFALLPAIGLGLANYFGFVTVPPAPKAVDLKSTRDESTKTNESTQDEATETADPSVKVEPVKNDTRAMSAQSTKTGPDLLTRWKTWWNKKPETAPAATESSNKEAVTRLKK